jgi:hypothetical protein
LIEEEDEELEEDKDFEDEKQRNKKNGGMQ